MQVGKTKKDIGCPDEMQLEDYITSLFDTKEMIDWKKKYVANGNKWAAAVSTRYIVDAQMYIFNKFMKQYGFTEQFTTEGTFEEYCKTLEENKLPITIFGNYPVLNNGGHISLGVGFDKNKKTVIHHDPYGNVEYDSYKTHKKGEYSEYEYAKYFLRSKHMWLLKTIKLS